MNSKASVETFIQQKKLKFKSGSIKPIKMKDIERKGYHFYMPIAGTYMGQSSHPTKVFEILRLRRLPHIGQISRGPIRKEGDIQYRLGYYIVGKNGNKKGKWTWGQYCPLIPRGDFFRLIQKAKKENTIQ
jgi:hypothetical protein